jgi:hypothetical protein
MLAFPNVFHFFAHELAGLRGRRFAFTLIFARSFNCFFFWHNKMVSPLATPLDVTKRVVTSCTRNNQLFAATVATEPRVRREQAVLQRVRAALLTEIGRSI